VRAAEEAKPEIITIAGKEYRIIPDKVFRKMGFEFPDVAREENAAYDYIRAINAYTRWEFEGPQNDPRDQTFQGEWPENDAALREYFEQNKKALKHLRAGAQKKACHFPFFESPLLKVPPEQIFHQMLSIELFSPLRELARFLRFVGVMREHDGDFAGSLEAYLDAAALGVHVGQDRLLINNLVGVAITQIGRAGIQECATRDQIDENVLLRAQQRLAAIRALRSSYLDMLRSERLFGGLALEAQLASESVGGFALFDEEPPRWKIALAEVLVRSAGFQQSVRSYNAEVMDVIERLAERPMAEYVERCSEEVAKVGERYFLRLPEVVTGPPSALVESRAVYEHDRLDWTVTDVVLALARYKVRHEQYPEKLEQATGFMLSDGRDPFSGEVLKYRRDGDEFVVWSVGENLVDDGGKVEVGSRWAQDDCVWSSRLLRGEE